MEHNSSYFYEEYINERINELKLLFKSLNLMFLHPNTGLNYQNFLLLLYNNINIHSIDGLSIEMEKNIGYKSNIDLLLNYNDKEYLIIKIEYIKLNYVAEIFQKRIKFKENKEIFLKTSEWILNLNDNDILFIQKFSKYLRGKSIFEYIGSTNTNLKKKSREIAEFYKNKLNKSDEINIYYMSLICVGFRIIQNEIIKL